MRRLWNCEERLSFLHSQAVLPNPIYGMRFGHPKPENRGTNSLNQLMIQRCSETECSTVDKLHEATLSLSFTQL